MNKYNANRKPVDLVVLYSSETQADDLPVELSLSFAVPDNTYVNPDPAPPAIVTVHNNAANQVGFDTYVAALAGAASGAPNTATMIVRAVALGSAAAVVSAKSNCTGSSCHSF